MTSNSNKLIEQIQFGFKELISDYKYNDPKIIINNTNFEMKYYNYECNRMIEISFQSDFRDYGFNIVITNIITQKSKIMFSETSSNFKKLKFKSLYENIITDFSSIVNGKEW